MTSNNFQTTDLYDVKPINLGDIAVLAYALKRVFPDDVTARREIAETLGLVEANSANKGTCSDASTALDAAYKAFGYVSEDGIKPSRDQ